MFTFSLEVFFVLLLDVMVFRANMTTLTRISLLLKKGRRADAIRVVNGYDLLLASSVRNVAGNNRLHGTVLHIAKAKKVQLSRSVSAEKRSKSEMSYYRLVFCR